MTATSISTHHHSPNAVGRKGFVGVPWWDGLSLRFIE